MEIDVEVVPPACIASHRLVRIEACESRVLLNGVVGPPPLRLFTPPYTLQDPSTVFGPTLPPFFTPSPPPVFPLTPLFIPNAPDPPGWGIDITISQGMQPGTQFEDPPDAYGPIFDGTLTTPQVLPFGGTIYIQYQTPLDYPDPTIGVGVGITF